MIRAIIVFLFLVIFANSALSQELASGFTHHIWTVDEGLPINSLNDITVTEDGFVWISTHNGMVRFDGLTHTDGELFNTINKGNNQAFNSNSLNEIIELNDSEFLVLENAVGEMQSVVGYTNREFQNRVTSAINFPYDVARLDDSGQIWAIKNSQLYSLRDNGWVNEFPSLNLELNGYIEFQVLSRDNIWILEKNIGRLRHIEKGVVKRIGKQQGLSSDNIGSFEVTKNGKVWFVTPTGIELIENGEVTIVHKHKPGFAYNQSSLLEDYTMDDRIIFQTWRNSMFKQYLVTKKAFQNVSEVDKNVELITPEESSNNDTGWLRLRNDVYYNGKVVYQHPAPIRNSFIDKTGALWFVSVGELHYIQRNTFDSFDLQSHNIENVYPIFEDHEGVIWVGLLQAELKTIRGSIAEVFDDLEEIPSNRFFSFLEDEGNEIWMGTSVGLFKWDRKSNIEEIKPFEDTDLKFVRGLIKDRNGTVWIGSESEIMSFSDKKGWTSYKLEDYEGRLQIRYIFEDSNGKIWFGSNNKGLLYVNAESDKLKEFEHNSVLIGQSIRSMHQDEQDIYWVGLDGHGLVRIQLDSDNSITSDTHFNESNGLHGQVIHSILEDDFGKVWMSSNKGVFWVSKKELEDYAEGSIERIYSTVYGKSDGLPGIEANGATQSSGIKTADGRFLFAMVAGIGIAYPDRINEKSTEVFTRIDNLIITDSTYHFSDERLVLDKENRDLQFNYAAYNFDLAPENIRFRYKLEGYDEDWIEVGDRKEAFYTNVPGGDYNFIVQSALFGYEWSENESKLAFSITRYFYETLWFKFLVALAFISLLYSAFKWRIRSSEKRAMELSLLVEEQTYQLKEQAEKLLEVDKAKSKFFANVSHEFRTPLTLIIGPLKDITKNTETITKEATEKKARLALRNSNRLLKLVNQILDISKVESGTLELKVSEVNLVSLIQSIVKAFGSLTEQRQVNVEQRFSIEKIPVFIDTDSIEKVFVNIISNAFKFTPTSGSISIKVEEGDEFINVEVIDSGPGVEESELAHIFDRFYQTNESSTVNQVGTGIGLALSKELIELHNGSIQAESELGSGLKITIRLRKGVDHFEEHQLAEMIEESNIEDSIEVEHEDVNQISTHVSEVGETTILIIDDNQEIRSYLHEHLSYSYRILEEENGLEGLKSAREHLPDIIICDVMMPKMDGYEFCKALKDNPETDFIPVILLTAKAEQSDKLEGLGLGADDYIMKPFDIEEVKARTNNLIQSRKKLMDRYSKSGIKLELPLIDLPKADVRFIKEIRNLVLTNMEDENFGVAELAEHALTSRRTLHNRIKKITNKSASDLIREIRLERAHQLLVAEAGTISEIAYSVGFKSISHFSRVFKEHFKMNPSEVETNEVETS